MAWSSVVSFGKDCGVIFEDTFEKVQLYIFPPKRYAIFFLQMPYLVPRIYRANGAIGISPSMGNGHGV